HLRREDEGCGDRGQRHLPLAQLLAAPPGGDGDRPGRHDAGDGGGRGVDEAVGDVHRGERYCNTVASGTEVQEPMTHVSPPGPRPRTTTARPTTWPPGSRPSTPTSTARPSTGPSTPWRRWASSTASRWARGAPSTTSPTTPTTTSCAAAAARWRRSRPSCWRP